MAATASCRIYSEYTGISQPYLFRRSTRASAENRFTRAIKRFYFKRIVYHRNRAGDK